MVLPAASNYITLSNVQTEFGGSAPINISEYYAGGSYVSASVTGVPTSGYISLAHFFGKSVPAPVGPATNVVQNPNFTSTASWTSSVGFGATDTNSVLYNSSKPVVITSDASSTYTSYLLFSYPQNQTVTQTVALTTPRSSYTFSYQVAGKQNGTNPVLDKFYANVAFKNAANTTIHTIGTTTYSDVTTQTWSSRTFTTSTDVSSATTAVITLSGYDNGYWNGNYGARFTQISLV